MGWLRAGGWIRAAAAQPAVWALALLLGARALLTVTLAPGRDELAYWYWARHALDASYSWMTVATLRLATDLAGDSVLAIRFVGLLAGALAPLLLAYTTRQLGASRAVAALTGLALAASPWHGYVGTVVHPDSLLTLLVIGLGALAALLPARAAIRGDSDRSGPPARQWLLPAIAVCAALASLTKLTAVVLFLPVIVWTARHARRDPQGAALAAAILAAAGSVLVASADGRMIEGLRHFGSFAGGVGLAGRLGRTAIEIVVEAGPALLLLALAGGAVAIRSRAARHAWPAWPAAAALLVFFAAFLVAGQAKGNWFLPALVLLAPPGAVALERAGRATALRSAAIVTVAGFLLLGVIWSLPSTRPDVWAWITRHPAVRALDPTYASHVGSRESEVSPTRSWSARLEEYGPRPEADPRVVRALGAGAAAIVSHDYGLAFELAWQTGRSTKVHLPWDPVYARSCGGEPPSGSSVVWVSRSREDPPADWAARFRAVRRLEAIPGSDPELRVFLCQELLESPPPAGTD